MSFTQRNVGVWNSLPTYVVNAMDATAWKMSGLIKSFTFTTEQTLHIFYDEKSYV